MTNQIKILYTFTSNEGQEFDNEENFCGYKTRTKLLEKVVDWAKVAETLESIYEIPADYGDGITNAHVLAVVDFDTNELLSKNIDFWKVGGDDE